MELEDDIRELTIDNGFARTRDQIDTVEVVDMDELRYFRRLHILLNQVEPTKAVQRLSYESTMEYYRT